MGRNHCMSKPTIEQHRLLVAYSSHYKSLWTITNQYQPSVIITMHLQPQCMVPWSDGFRGLMMACFFSAGTIAASDGPPQCLWRTIFLKVTIEWIAFFKKVKLVFFLSFVLFATIFWTDSSPKWGGCEVLSMGVATHFVVANWVTGAVPKHPALSCTHLLKWDNYPWFKGLVSLI